jgi:cell division protein FtsW (lipid II flippase)
MDQTTYPKVAATALIVLGFGLLASLSYYYSRSDFEPMNVNANLTVLFAILLVALPLALFRGHEAGAGIAAIVIGGILFMLTFRTQDPGYFVPPLSVFFGGLPALYAYALKVRVIRPVLGQTN